ncbi:hypothetical protein L195_g047373, partial [Trifolium pratense]
RQPLRFPQPVTFCNSSQVVGHVSHWEVEREKFKLPRTSYLRSKNLRLFISFQASMASSANLTRIPFAGKWTEFPIADGGVKYVPEPIDIKEHKQIWQSQVMIPFAVQKNVYAFGGPFPDELSLDREVDKTQEF